MFIDRRLIINWSPGDPERIPGVSTLAEAMAVASKFHKLSEKLDIVYNYEYLEEGETPPADDVIFYSLFDLDGNEVGLYFPTRHSLTIYLTPLESSRRKTHQCVFSETGNVHTIQ